MTRSSGSAERSRHRAAWLVRGGVVLVAATLPACLVQPQVDVDMGGLFGIANRSSERPPAGGRSYDPFPEESPYITGPGAGSANSGGAVSAAPSGTGSPSYRSPTPPPYGYTSPTPSPYPYITWSPTPLPGTTPLPGPTLSPTPTPAPTPTETPTEVRLDKSRITLNAKPPSGLPDSRYKTDEQLVATVCFARGCDPPGTWSVEWGSSNPALVGVTTSGLVFTRPGSAGDAVVYAQAFGTAVTATCSVTVTAIGHVDVDIQ